MEVRQHNWTMGQWNNGTMGQWNNTIMEPEQCSKGLFMYLTKNMTLLSIKIHMNIILKDYFHFILCNIIHLIQKVVLEHI